MQHENNDQNPDTENWQGPRIWSGTKIKTLNHTYPQADRRISRGGVTRRGHDDELIGSRDSFIVDLDCDAATCTGDPPEMVELTAELGDQGLCFSHWVALQIRLWSSRRWRSYESWRHFLQPICLSLIDFWFGERRSEVGREGLRRFAGTGTRWCNWRQNYAV